MVCVTQVFLLLGQQSRSPPKIKTAAEGKGSVRTRTMQIQYAVCADKVGIFLRRPAKINYVPRVANSSIRLVELNKK